GSGFSAQDLAAIGAQLTKSEAGDAPLGAEDETRDARWLAPSLVVEVRFKTRGQGGRLRQPVFVALRNDKAPEDCWLPGDDKPPPLAPPDAVDGSALHAADASPALREDAGGDANAALGAA